MKLLIHNMHVFASVDILDPAIAAIYRANLSHPIVKQDLSDVPATVKAVKTLSPEIIIGGPPCQGFSHAGKRSEGGRADLTINFAEIVTTVKPA